MRYTDFKIVEARLKEQTSPEVAAAATRSAALDGSTRDLPIPVEIADPVLRLAPSLRQFVTYNSKYGIVGIKTVNGNTIRDLQTSLNRTGNYNLSVDGNVGNNTQAAIIDIFYTIAATNGIGESSIKENQFDDIVAATGQVYVIGDSHALAMGGTNNLASNGARLDAIAGQASNVPNGATVYMTGGHNDVAGGARPQSIAGLVKSIITSLESKGCTVNYILFPEGSSNTNQNQMGPTRTAISTAVTVSKDLEGCSLSDGKHCQMSSYTGIVTGNAPSNTNPNDPNAEVEATGLQAGPPYPAEQSDDVKALQTRLEELGYSVGSTGIDGKYGPRTERAVAAFKRDNNVTPASGRNLDATASATLASATKVENPTPTGNNSRAADVELGDLADIANLPQAKEVVEEYLGKPISDSEMNMLVRAIASEASRHNLERAAVAAVILNRVRTNYGPRGGYGTSIPAQLRAPAQFQAVTGTRTGPRDSEGRKTWTGPHENYTNMTSTTGGQVVGTLIQNLADQDRTWMNFTSNIASAYGAGTRIDFMYAMRDAPNSQVIGKTVFGTA